MKTIQELATEARSDFVRSTRDNGAAYWHRKEIQKDWIDDMCYQAHGGNTPTSMLPDDWRYQFIVDALDALSEHEDEDEARDSLEASIYTHDLTAWLGSHGYRPAYCDEAVDEYGAESFFGKNGGGLTNLIQAGQLAEMQEVFGLVLDALRTQSKETDDEGEEETEEVPS
jgi:hypothetical protein